MRLRDRDAGQARNEMQADPDNKQSGPADKLQMAVNLNKAVKSFSQRKIQTNDSREMRPDRKTAEEGDTEGGPDETEVEFSLWRRTHVGNVF